ncbi:L-cysteine desulfhydrase 1 isoform X2 [Chlorella sorokiniana]|uniref:L-cysteine desulfhydrase 1 isoform X2 n=1 Tax=Chlorella sorokiniana TaxID=3076 RepID=A0A2P6TXP3_CHLSO|nr:L-cysteine desulfhydrase 1 isoform X2 [Chlorella sorokiniana]|eukprot:PRW58839.1 L-cysteine desulfhydrase 1 isoform X2 [Chlorella sorokiniana]
MAADPAWQPPPNPCEAAAGELPAPGELGAAARRHFLIDFDSWTFINHGAFGGALRCAQQEAEAWRRRCEAQPLFFLDRELFAQLVRVMRELAAFAGCRPQDLALLPNATTGLNTVVQSWRGRLGPDDALFSLDIGYGSVKKMLAVVAEQTGAQHVEMAVQLPLSRPEELVAQVAAALPANAKLAVFDAVTSNTAIVLPIWELVQLCHSRGVQVLIDGAHAPGQLPLDLEELGADYFVANCHKWLCAPRGSAFMHVRPEHQRHVRPLIVSHGYGSGFVSEFIWDGCRDYAPLLAISAALRALRQLGPEAAQAHQRQLLAAAVDCLVAAWGTGTLVPLSMCGAMALVELPPGCTTAAQSAGAGDSTAAAAAAAAAAGGKSGGRCSSSSATSADAKWVQDTLHYQHRIECPVKCVGGRLYVRISAHIYNELADYERLAAAVRSMAGLEQA